MVDLCANVERWSFNRWWLEGYPEFEGVCGWWSGTRQTASQLLNGRQDGEWQGCGRYENGWFEVDAHHASSTSIHPLLVIWGCHTCVHLLFQLSGCQKCSKIKDYSPLTLRAPCTISLPSFQSCQLKSWEKTRLHITGAGSILNMISIAPLPMAKVKFEQALKVFFWKTFDGSLAHAKSAPGVRW